MQLSNDEIKTGGIVVTWLVTVCGFVWGLSKFHSRVEVVEAEVKTIKQSHLVTRPDFDTLQLLCRTDVDNQLRNNAHAVDQVTATQSVISQDIKELASVVGEMDKKVAVIYAKVNKT